LAALRIQLDPLCKTHMPLCLTKFWCWGEAGS